MLRLKHLLAALVGLTFLSGCFGQSVPEIQGQAQAQVKAQPTSTPTTTAVGVSLGALAGGLLGGVVAGEDDRTKGVAVGAVAGAAVGGLIAANLDRQTNELQQRMAPAGVQVFRQADHIELVLPGDITFSSGSANLQVQFYGPLSELASSLQRYPNSDVYVLGHTDNLGSYDYNLQLSQLRANAVAGYFANSGIGIDRLFTQAYAWNRPKADNSTPAGQAVNRRVEIKIFPRS